MKFSELVQQLNDYVRRMEDGQRKEVRAEFHSLYKNVFENSAFYRTSAVVAKMAQLVDTQLGERFQMDLTVWAEKLSHEMALRVGETGEQTLDRNIVQLVRGLQEASPLGFLELIRDDSHNLFQTVRTAVAWSILIGGADMMYPSDILTVFDWKESAQSKPFWLTVSHACFRAEGLEIQHGDSMADLLKFSNKQLESFAKAYNGECTMGQ